MIDVRFVPDTGRPFLDQICEDWIKQEAHDPHDRGSLRSQAYTAFSENLWVIQDSGKRRGEAIGQIDPSSLRIDDVKFVKDQPPFMVVRFSD